MEAAYYQASVESFIQADVEFIVGVLTLDHHFELKYNETKSWKELVLLLQSSLMKLNRGYILLEFRIPRVGKRADVVLVVDETIFVIEFKVGAEEFRNSAMEQVYDYALDLKNFHKGSHDALIVPVLIATAAEANGKPEVRYAPDGVAAPVLAHIGQLYGLIELYAGKTPNQPIDLESWLHSGYQPTPTIIEAAQTLFRNHSVVEIARHGADAPNLSRTIECISNIIDVSKKERRKSICFLTGVPGAGKTLAGLHMATIRAQEHPDERAVFLSGNGPLVKVLREALARDEIARKGTKKTDAYRKVSSFIQNVHHFRGEAVRTTRAPYEKVVIFDEAQRAWDKKKTSEFMKTKRGQTDFNMSEPAFFIDAMNRHEDWCTIICLIGNGQEINTGEAGLSEWLLALESQSGWDVYLSDRMDQIGYEAGDASKSLSEKLHAHLLSDLHLSTSMRSFRAESLSSLIGLVLDNRADEARRIYAEMRTQYPILVTRDLSAARTWLRAAARGTERAGLVASSGAYRLRPEGLHVKVRVKPTTWFLGHRDHVCSSLHLEEVATEFDVQGLELDWVGVCWDANFRHQEGNWNFFNFRGTKWERVNQIERRRYIRNSYRVNLTRARQGMVIFVPKGDELDGTRSPAYYDDTYAFLKQCGFTELDSADAVPSAVSSP